MTNTNENLIGLFQETAKSQAYKLADGTIEMYTYYIGNLLKYLDNKLISEITSDDIISYTLSLNCSDSYLNASLSAYRTLYDILTYHPKTKYFITSNPTIGVKGAKKVENKIKQVILTSTQQEILIKYAKNYRDKAILKLYLSTGLRVHELVGLTLEQYNNRDRQDNNRIDLTITKGSHDRSIWLSNDVVEAIDDYLTTRKECEYDNLFISNGKKPMDRTCLSRTLKTIAKRSGKFTDEEISKIANHTCRRSISSTLLNEKDVPIDVVAKFLGHSNLSSVMRYAKTDNNRVKMAMIGQI